MELVERTLVLEELEKIEGMNSCNIRNLVAIIH